MARTIRDRVCMPILVLSILATAIRSQAQEFPSLPAGREIQPGIRFSQVTLTRAGLPMKVWVYLPSRAPSAKLPCILIAPAGTRMFHGIGIVDGDRPEHTPYVLRGYAVVAYDLDGAVPDNPTDGQLATALTQFRKAEGGVANARAALNFVLASVPEIDGSRIFAVGHSSAATIALQVAQSDPRITACVAFAPICDLGARLRRVGPLLDRVQPGTLAYLEQISPNANITKLKCPTMLFTAEDDTNVPSESVRAFAQDLQKTNKQVKLVAVKAGGHYDSMIDEGIPAAIAWLKQLPATRLSVP